MRPLSEIIAGDLNARARRYTLELLEELQKCADALGPDSPRGISARALVDKIMQPVREQVERPVVTGPHRYEPHPGIPQAATDALNAAVN